MSSPRTRSLELAKLFNAAKQPIYVLDEELTVVFLNRACEDWLAAPESLVGRRCAYHSSLTVTGLDAVAASLCPPPEVLAGEIAVATVSRVDESGRPSVRSARFVPLGIKAECLLGVLAVLDTVDQPPALSQRDAAGELQEAEPNVLHEHVRRFRQEAAARYRADRLIGDGPAMRLARRQVELATVGGASVLLVGPPGSGRRHLAAAIHYGASPPSPERLAAPTLVPLDCSLLGPDLLEEVAGAVARGRLLDEKTVPGTLLLHRVDEISSDLQVELAGLFVRRPLNWRLMATAAGPLAELARRGKFREDLAAALSTIVIELPSLARRREDLPLLAQLFLEDLNATGHRQIGGFSAAALDLLDGYAWPGNLDELAEVVAESHRRAAGREIDVADLPERLRLASQAAAHPHRPEETIVLNEYLGRVERELIRRALPGRRGTNRGRPGSWA